MGDQLLGEWCCVMLDFMKQCLAAVQHAVQGCLAQAASPIAAWCQLIICNVKGHGVVPHSGLFCSSAK